jgi:hypothetical protein
MSTLPTRRRQRRLRTLLVALCALLFAQWTLAAHACPVIVKAGELIAQAQLAEELSAAADCHGMPADQEPAAPTCLKHCADDGSTSGGSTLLSVAAPPALSVLRADPPAVAPPPLHEPQLARDATAPPLTILYCVSLT